MVDLIGLSRMKGEERDRDAEACSGGGQGWKHQDDRH